MNRRRLKGKGGEADCRAALETLFGVVLTVVRIMAPFTPFLTENMYQQLRKKVSTLSGSNCASVLYLMLPTAREDLIYEDVEGCREDAVLRQGSKTGRLCPLSTHCRKVWCSTRTSSAWMISVALRSTSLRSSTSRKSHFQVIRQVMELHLKQSRTITRPWDSDWKVPSNLSWPKSNN